MTPVETTGFVGIEADRVSAMFVVSVMGAAAAETAVRALLVGPVRLRERTENRRYPTEGRPGCRPIVIAQVVRPLRAGGTSTLVWGDSPIHSVTR